MIIYLLKEWQTTFFLRILPAVFPSSEYKSLWVTKCQPNDMKCSVSASLYNFLLAQARCKLQTFPSEQFLQRYIWTHCYEYYISISSIPQLILHSVLCNQHRLHALPVQYFCTDPPTTVWDACEIFWFQLISLINVLYYNSYF